MDNVDNMDILSFQPVEMLKRAMTTSFEIFSINCLENFTDIQLSTSRMNDRSTVRFCFGALIHLFGRNFVKIRSGKLT